MHQPLPKNILIVDDDTTTTHLIVHCLKLVIAEKIVVRNGEEAVKYVQKNPPDLILMDYSMPGISGIEALQQIRDLPYGKNIPIIMITGTDQTQIRHDAKSLNALLFMTKPFSPNQLIHHTKAILDI